MTTSSISVNHRGWTENPAQPENWLDAAFLPSHSALPNRHNRYNHPIGRLRSIPQAGYCRKGIDPPAWNYLERALHHDCLGHPGRDHTMRICVLLAVTAVLFIGLGCGSSHGQAERITPAGDPVIEALLRVNQQRAWTSIVIHHTASETGSVESIDTAHRARRDADGNPWKGIGYHFLIGNGHGMKDGEIAPTFRWKDQIDGAHAGNAEYNQNGIGICLVGNFEEGVPTDAQIQAVRRLITGLRKRCRIEVSGIVRHQDVRATACPGKLFPWEDVIDNQLALKDGAVTGARRNP